MRAILYPVSSIKTKTQICGTRIGRRQKLVHWKKSPQTFTKRLGCKVVTYEDRYLYEARLLFRMLFTNLVLRIDDHKITYDLISKKNTRLRRLKLIEVQVGIIMYDLHCSKARKVSFPRIILHILSPSYPLFLH
ncbi:hypothetical protein NC653_024150 [Populus alba x Populus x berolinensis]|uniref:Uncharacterized protein n=1 Tax=Populus alba x Populus x berolinensis TaxID=444605 RepID=A0AAD6M871_9ROSI|nr:hypothetical protein NC653_024150 [Populus alba x Populus x berolinensis]